MVKSFGNTGSLVAINCIAFWGVVPCNVLDYTSVVGEYVIWAACNSEMYFDLCTFLLGLKLAILNHQNLNSHKTHQQRKHDW
jgi:hypothetical protein